MLASRPTLLILSENASGRLQNWFSVSFLSWQLIQVHTWSARRWSAKICFTCCRHCHAPLKPFSSFSLSKRVSSVSLARYSSRDMVCAVWIKLCLKAVMFYIIFMSGHADFTGVLQSWQRFYLLLYCWLDLETASGNFNWRAQYSSVWNT